MNVEFKHARPGDLPKIVATYNSTIPSRLVTADLEPVTVDSRRSWFRSHNPENRPMWIVSCDGEYAGWISFNSFYGRPAYDGAVEVSIYLEEKFRGKGLGKICLKKALEAAPALEIHTLLGFIFGHNEPSLQLFRSFGFEQMAKLPTVANMDGVMRDLIIMGKKIAV